MDSASLLAMLIVILPPLRSVPNRTMAVGGTVHVTGRISTADTTTAGSTRPHQRPMESCGTTEEYFFIFLAKDGDEISVWVVYNTNEMNMKCKINKTKPLQFVWLLQLLMCCWTGI